VFDVDGMAAEPPPVLLPEAAELAATAGASAVVIGLRKYVMSLGGGAEPGEEPIAAWAEACGLVRRVKGELVAVKKRAKLLQQPTELWQCAYQGLAGYVGTRVAEPSASAGLLPELAWAVCAKLYASARSPVPVEPLHSEVSQALPASRRGELTATLDALELLGAVELTGKTDRHPGTVALTPIGLWGVNQALRAVGVPAPTLNDLVEADLETVCAELAVATSDMSGALLAAWVKHRGDAAAAAELAAFIECSERPISRLFALMGLCQTGEHGVAEGHRLRARGGIPGSVTVGWLVEVGAIPVESVDQGEVALGMTDHFAALHELDLFIPDLLDKPLDEQLTLVRMLTGVDHPCRLDLLDAIAARHPEKSVAKVAGKARMKLRSAEIQR
jgi:hypothetical protein